MNIGDVAPHISLYDTNRKKVNLSDFSGQKVFILFFPAAWTSVCTKEMCSVRDNFSFYEELNINVIGISVDSPFALKQFKEGEKRLLFSYAPVIADHAYNETGPVFIHENCLPYNETFKFPEEIKNGRRPIHLVLRCYNKEKRMILARFVKDNNEVENNVAVLFEDPLVEFIHIRNATYQCFIAEVRKYQGTGS